MRKYQGFSRVDDLWMQDIICFRTYMFAMKWNGRTTRKLPDWVLRRADEARAIHPIPNK